MWLTFAHQFFDFTHLDNTPATHDSAVSVNKVLLSQSLSLPLLLSNCRGAIRAEGSNTFPGLRFWPSNFAEICRKRILAGRQSKSSRKWEITPRRTASANFCGKNTTWLIPSPEFTEWGVEKTKGDGPHLMSSCRDTLTQHPEQRPQWNILMEMPVKCVLLLFVI